MQYDEIVTEQLLTVQDVADLLNVSASAIYHWRLIGEGPPAITIGKNRLRFDPQQLRAWIVSRSEPL